MSNPYEPLAGVIDPGFAAMIDGAESVEDVLGIAGQLSQPAQDLLRAAFTAAASSDWRGGPIAAAADSIAMAKVMQLLAVIGQGMTERSGVDLDSTPASTPS